MQNVPLSSTTEAVVYKVKDKAPASASCCESAAKVPFANYFCTHIHIYADTHNTCPTRSLYPLLRMRACGVKTAAWQPDATVCAHISRVSVCVYVCTHTYVARVHMYNVCVCVHMYNVCVCVCVCVCDVCTCTYVNICPTKPMQCSMRMLNHLYTRLILDSC